MSNQINNNGYSNEFIEIITTIGETMDDLHKKYALTEPPDIQSQINSNDLTEIEPLIKDYSLYINTIEETKKLLEQHSDTRLYWIKTSDIIKSKYIELVVLNKDSTQSQIWYELKNYILKFNNITDYALERVLEIIIVYLFVKCKIFITQ